MTIITSPNTNVLIINVLNTLPDLVNTLLKYFSLLFMKTARERPRPTESTIPLFQAK